MTVRLRGAGLLGGLIALALLDVVIARADVFGALDRGTRPTSLLSSINAQLIDVVRVLQGNDAAGDPHVVFLGNSQTEGMVRPLGELATRLGVAGAGEAPRASSLCVFATAPTDAEATTRHLSDVRADVVVLGFSPPDLATPPARARSMPLTAMFDVGWRAGLLTPPDVEAWIDRWVRSRWTLYRYRRLLRHALWPRDEPQTPATWLDERATLATILTRSFGAAEADRLVALRAAALRTNGWPEIARYVNALRGPGYLPGLRDRWRAADPQPVQLAALRGMVTNVRGVGAVPVWLLVPENPWLLADPEIGPNVRRRSDATAAEVRSAAAAADVMLLDYRDALAPEAFLDLNHVAYNSGVLHARLTADLVGVIDRRRAAAGR